MRTNLGHLSDIEIVHALLDINGLSLLDVGCGSGATARLLVEGGAVVVGIEPDPVQAQRNREAEHFPGLTLTEGKAEALPQQDDSVDGVFFFRSLHHVAAEGMDSALQEARRVVRPGGFVLVLEPSIEGSFSKLMRPFHDETIVRAAAQEALARAATDPNITHKQYECIQYGSYPSFNALVERFSSMSFNSITPEMIDVPAVRQSFEEGHTDSGYVFEQPILIDVFRPRVSPSAR